MRRKIMVTIAAVVVVGFAVAAVVAANARRKLEKPVYAVVSEHEKFEIRRYEPRLVAEVVVAGDAREASNAGFRILADYIFHDNATQTKIAMTAPVERTAKGDQWAVAFTMPSTYTLDTLPAPNDPRVEIREVPATTYAAQRFSGAPRESAVQARMRELEAAVETAGFELGGPPIYARYDPPWTLGFLRRNEILVELAVEED